MSLTHLEAKPDLNIGFLLMNQFTLASVAGLVESLRFAADESFTSRQIFCRWSWMTANNQPVMASCGLRVSPTTKLNFSTAWDYFVVAGGLLEETRNPPEWLLQSLRELHARNVPIITFCSGIFVAGSAGLLDGRQCAIHFTTRDEFKLRFPKAIPIIDKSYIKDGTIITCPGGTAIDLAADLIRQHCGRIRSQKVLKYLLVDENPSKPAKAKPKVTLAIPDSYDNELVNELIAFMKQHLASPMPLSRLAALAGVSTRQLNLMFTQCTDHSAAVYWRRMRLDTARKLMTDSTKTIHSIALATGFAGTSHLIAWFRKQYGETPSSFRKRRRDAEKLVKL
jgi:transcriptional regulator GlxA family with amidase domain